MTTIMKTKFDRRARFIQNTACRKYFKRKPNSFDAQSEAVDIVREDGVRVITDIPYGTKYPNSFLDIYLPKKEWMESAGENGVPVFVYFHGGGFLFGNRRMGDPLTKDPTGMREWFGYFLDKGIGVVSASYAFAPEYRFPVQIEQVDQVLGFLGGHGKEYGLDSDQMLLGGGSAGADMTEIYGLVISDSSYAAQFPFVPTVRREQIKGLIIDEAALCFHTFKNPKGMDTMLGCWVGEEDFLHGPNSILCDVPEHIADSYIPTFVTGSTADHFFIQSALKLKVKLDEIGVRCDLYYPPLSMGEFGHGFLSQAETPAGKAGNEKMIRFIDAVLGK